MYEVLGEKEEEKTSFGRRIKRIVVFFFIVVVAAFVILMFIGTSKSTDDLHETRLRECQEHPTVIRALEENSGYYLVYAAPPGMFSKATCLVRSSENRQSFHTFNIWD